MILNIQTNELSNSTKNTMKQRTLSSLFMFFFLLIIFVFAIFADNTNNWSPFTNINIKIGFAWSVLLIMIPLIIICAKEISNIYFRFSIFAYICILMNMIILIYGPTMIYFLKYYHYINISIGNFYETFTMTNIFAIILSCAILFVVIIDTFLLIYYSELNFKNWVIFNLLVGVISGFFLGFFFFAFTRGFLTLLWLVMIVFSSDIFAYFGGLLFGKHKMAPKISPKKTWEGFIIGQVCTILIGILILFGYSFIVHNPEPLKEIFGIQFQKEIFYINNNQFANKPLWWLNMFIITASLSLLSVFGDLLFSWFKRKYRIKDYGNLIPGHGGIIDRIDSHSVVISFYFVLSFFIALGARTVVFFEI